MLAGMDVKSSIAEESEENEESEIGGSESPILSATVQFTGLPGRFTELPLSQLKCEQSS